MLNCGYRRTENILLERHVVSGRVCTKNMAQLAAKHFGKNQDIFGKLAPFSAEIQSFINALQKSVAIYESILWE